MPYLIDEFGKTKEVSAAVFYLTGLVDQLFDSTLDILGGRIEVPDFRRNWYELVAFILFVTRREHFRAGRDFHADIQSYIRDQSNPDSYLHQFNNPEYRSLQRHDPALLADRVAASYTKYWELYNACTEKKEDPSFAINDHLGRMLATGGTDQPNLHDALSYLTTKFDRGEAKLFEA